VLLLMCGEFTGKVSSSILTGDGRELAYTCTVKTPSAGFELANLVRDSEDSIRRVWTRDPSEMASRWRPGRSEPISRIAAKPHG
jgi:hypothetical protein